MSNTTNKEKTIKDLVSYLENWSNDANDSRNRYEATYDYFAALQLSAHCKDKEEWVKKALYDYKMLLDEYQHSDYSLYNNALNSLK